MIAMPPPKPMLPIFKRVASKRPRVMGPAPTVVWFGFEKPMSLPLAEDLFRATSVYLGFQGRVGDVPFFAQESAGPQPPVEVCCLQLVIAVHCALLGKLNADVGHRSFTRS